MAGRERSWRARRSPSSPGCGAGGRRVRYEDLLLVTGDACETLMRYGYDLTAAR